MTEFIIGFMTCAGLVFGVWAWNEVSSVEHWNQ